MQTAPSAGSGESQVPVLVVEDESLVSNYVEDILAGTRFRVVGVARAASEAMELASRLHPRLAIVDLSLEARLDGMETARLLRERFGTAVVLVTGSPVAGIAAGAAPTASTRFLRKPFLPRQLLAVLAEAVADSPG